MKSEKEIELEQREQNSIRLHQAIDKCDIAEVEQILKSGNVDIEFEYSGILNISITPLCKLSLLCRKIETIFEDDALKMMQILIKYGADINIEWSGMSPLLCAIGSDPKFSLIKCLLNAGADVNLGSRITPLSILYKPVSEMLLAHGADMHHIDQERELSHFDYLKSKIEDTDRYNLDDHKYYKANYNLYMKADLVDSLFNRKNKDIVLEKLKAALEEITEFSDKHIDFMLSRFKSLCAIKNSKATKQESADFMDHLNKIIAYEFLPEKLKNGLQDIIKDYGDITDNIEGFALWDALSIYAEENKSQQIKAPISFKLAQAILAEGSLADEKIFQSISDFCEQHPIYKEHSYLQNESNKDEIVMIMLIYTDFACKVREFFDKYKGVFYSEVLSQAIDDYEHMKPLTGDTTLSLSEKLV